MSFTLSTPTQIYNLLQQWQTDYASGSFGKRTVNAAVMAITIDTTDSVSFSDYAGKKIVGVAGIKAADSDVINLKNAAGYQLTAANEFDAIYINGASISLISVLGDFNLTMPFTGVGTSAEWNTGELSAVVVFYIDDVENSISSSMIQFTTVEAQSDYTDTGLSGKSIAIVFYGQGILSPDQYSLAGSTITIDPGFPVEGDKRLVIFTSN